MLRYHVVDPYGLLSRTDRRYLIADVDRRPRMFALTRPDRWDLLDEPGRLRDGVRLADLARDLCRRLRAARRASASCRSSATISRSWIPTRPGS